MENTLFVLLGWAAGLLSALILDWNKSRRTTLAVSNAVINELRELSNRFAHVVYQLAIRTDSLDAELLTWLVEAHERYDGANRNEQYVANLKTMASDPEQVARDVAVIRELKPASAPGLRKYPTPALDVAMQVIADLPHSQQVAIFEIRTALATFDALGDDSREFFRMTSEDLSESNMAAVIRNQNSAYSQALQVAREVVDRSAHLVWPGTRALTSRR